MDKLEKLDFLLEHATYGTLNKLYKSLLNNHMHSGIDSFDKFLNLEFTYDYMFLRALLELEYPHAIYIDTDLYKDV